MDDVKKGTQLLEVYALEIQMYTEQKNSKKLKALYEQSLHIKSAIPHPLIMGVIRGEGEGKGKRRERRMERAKQKGRERREGRGKKERKRGEGEEDRERGEGRKMSEGVHAQQEKEEKRGQQPSTSPPSPPFSPSLMQPRS